MLSNKLNFTSWHFFLVTVLVLGIFFRFVNLDRKVYWIEESATSIRISGYTWKEIDQELGVNNNVQQLISVQDLQKYQHINPEKGLMGTLKGLALEEPQLPPLYFVMVRLWVQWFGDSVAVTRSLSALSSLLIFPCLYWLCLELFESSFVGWMALALIAVSPFHIVYAQEARPYSLWAATTLLSSAVLLQAIRLKTKLSWGIYAATVPLGLYSHAFFGLVAIVHGIYVVLIEGFRLSKTVIAYLIASLTGTIIFLPWIFFIINNFSQVDETTSWAQKKTWALWGVSSQFTLLAKWVRNVSAIFIDTDRDQRIIYLGFENLFAYLIQLLLIASLVTMVVYSMGFLYRHAAKRAWLFILLLIGVTALPLMLPDLILGTTRSTAPRYLTPCYLGIQLAVAYLLATKIASISKKIWLQKLWRLIAITLVSGGILSAIVISQAESWWTKYESYNDLQMARIVNQTTQPILIFGGKEASGRAMSMSYLLAPKVRIQLMMESNDPKIYKGFSDVFLFRPSEELLDKLKKKPNSKLEPVYQYTKSWLGRLDKGILLWRL
jgi:uncharacterized membrane protein